MAKREDVGDVLLGILTTVLLIVGWAVFLAIPAGIIVLAILALR